MFWVLSKQGINFFPTWVIRFSSTEVVNYSNCGFLFVFLAFLQAWDNVNIFRTCVKSWYVIIIYYVYILCVFVVLCVHCWLLLLLLLLLCFFFNIYKKMLDCWLEVSIWKVLWPAISTQVFLGFPLSISKCWDGSQHSKLPLHASHVALPT